jgi:hypothetical protein
VLTDKCLYSPTHHLSRIADEKRLNPGGYDADPSAGPPLALDGFRANRRRLESYRPWGTSGRATGHLPVWPAYKVSKKANRICPGRPWRDAVYDESVALLDLGRPTRHPYFNA